MLPVYEDSLERLSRVQYFTFKEWLDQASELNPWMSCYVDNWWDYKYNIFISCWYPLSEIPNTKKYQYYMSSKELELIE
jgi:hypothetical protein